MSGITTPLHAQQLFSGTVAPTGADVLDEARLTAWMEANVEGFRGPLRQSKFAGGQQPVNILSLLGGDMTVNSLRGLQNRVTN